MRHYFDFMCLTDTNISSCIHRHNWYMSEKKGWNVYHGYLNTETTDSKPPKQMKEHSVPALISQHSTQQKIHMILWL